MKEKTSGMKVLLSVLLLAAAFSFTTFAESAAPGPGTAPAPAPAETLPAELPPIETGIYDAYYDDAVFVGDSITQGLQNIYIYSRQKGTPVLGGARFLAAQSYMLDTAAGPYKSGRVNLKYQGQPMDIAEALKLMAPGKIFVMLGVNDEPCWNIPGNLNAYARMIEKIRTACPDALLVIESCTPVTTAKEKKGVNNKGLDAINAGLIALCAEKGCGYVDIASPLKDAGNGLNPAYTHDNDVHLNNTGLMIWVNTLRGYARQKAMEGQWTPVIPEPETEEAAETEAETSAAAAAKDGDAVKQAVSGPGEK